MAQNHRSHGSDERDEMIVRLHGQDCSTPQIAERVGMSEGGIRSALIRLGLATACGAPSKKWTAERLTELRELWLAGVSASQIARKFGRPFTRGSVIGKVNRLRLTRSPEAAAIAARIHSRKPPRRPTAPPVEKPKGNNPLGTAHLTDKAPCKPLPAPKAPAVVVDVSNAKPWIQRGRFECTWIVSDEGTADALACCNPIARGSWCAGHAKIGLVPRSTRSNDPAHELIRSLRRWAAA